MNEQQPLAAESSKEDKLDKYRSAQEISTEQNKDELAARSTALQGMWEGKAGAIPDNVKQQLQNENFFTRPTEQSAKRLVPDRYFDDPKMHTEVARVTSALDNDASVAKLLEGAYAHAKTALEKGQADWSKLEAIKAVGAQLVQGNIESDKSTARLGEMLIMGAELHALSLRGEKGILNIRVGHLEQFINAYSRYAKNDDIAPALKRGLEKMVGMLQRSPERTQKEQAEEESTSPAQSTEQAQPIRPAAEETAPGSDETSQQPALEEPLPATEEKSTTDTEEAGGTEPMQNEEELPQPGDVNAGPPSAEPAQPEPEAGQPDEAVLSEPAHNEEVVSQEEKPASSEQAPVPEQEDAEEARERFTAQELADIADKIKFNTQSSLADFMEECSHRDLNSYEKFYDGFPIDAMKVEAKLQEKHPGIDLREVWAAVTRKPQEKYVPAQSYKGDLLPLDQGEREKLLEAARSEMLDPRFQQADTFYDSIREAREKKRSYEVWLKVKGNNMSDVAKRKINLPKLWQAVAESEAA